MRVKSGDQGAESIFAAVKRNISRMNLQSSTKSASINFLACSWLKRTPGFASVVEGLRMYQSAIRSKTDPAKAYKDTTWLTSLEPVE